MKVVKLHEQTSEQFLNHTQNPKIAYQRPKKSKTTPKLSQNQKTQLKETKSIKACVGAFRTLLFNSYLSPLQCVSLLFLLTNPKSKSKSRLTAGFSLESDFPTTFTHPPQASHLGKVSKKQDTVIYPKQKLLVYQEVMKHALE